MNMNTPYTSTKELEYGYELELAYKSRSENKIDDKNKNDIIRIRVSYYIEVTGK